MAKATAAKNGTSQSSSQSTSVLSANAGNLTIQAGLDSPYKGTGQGNVVTQGADLLAGNSVAIKGNAVDLQAIVDTSSSSNHFESHSFAVGAALAGTIGSKITAIEDNIKLAQTTQNDRLQGAATLKAGYDAYKLASGLGQPKDLPDPQPKSDLPVDEKPTKGDPGGAAFGVSVSLTSSSSTQDSLDTSSLARGTNIQGKNISIAATEGDLNATGAKLQATDISLEAARNVNLSAATNSTTTKSTNDSNTVGGGVTIGGGQQNGVSIQISASQANGKTNGSETRYDNTLITASHSLNVKSGGDTSLLGAQLAADRVKLDIGGDLFIATRQDQSDFKSEQSSSGFSVNLCIPPICYGTMVTGSVRIANQSIDHNYQSATGQSGIAAGTGGFDIQVAGNTDLKGGAITSTATPDNNRLSTASLTSSDLHNQQSTNSQSSSIGLGYGGGSALATLAQNGASNLLGNLAGGAGLPANSSQSSATQSVISAGTISITGTGDAAKDANSASQVASLTTRDATKANGALTNTLTLQQAQDIPKQQQTAQENAQAGQLVGSVAFNIAGDVAKANGWEDSSPQKILLHGIAGYIQSAAGGQSAVAGALAGAANEAVTKTINGMIADANPYPARPANATKEELQHWNAQVDQVNADRKALGEAAASMVGVVAVAGAGGTRQQMATGGTVALTADQFNRQLHESESKKLTALKAGKTPAEQDRLDAAACALVQCANGIPDSDPNKSRLIAMQTAGAGYSNELNLLNATGEFVYQPYTDTLRDAITRNGQTVQRVGGAVNLVAGAVGTVAGGVIAAGGAVACPETGISCAAVPLGAAIATGSYVQAQDGSKALVGSYVSNEGQRVLDSFNAATYPGERDPLATGLQKGGELVFIAALGKYIPKGLAGAEGLEVSAGKVTGGANGGARIESLAANDVRFSQNTVSYNKVDRISGEKYTYDDLVQSMKTGGWKGDPVDVVKMPDGAFTSMDNTRISAARDAGINVQANVHGFNDPLPANMIANDRFGDAKTWGEALAGRISNQKPPSFGNANPNGSPTAPRITGRP